MVAKLKVSDAWKSITQIKLKSGGAWKNVTQGKLKVAGAWKTFFISGATSEPASTVSISQSTDSTTKLVTLTGTNKHWSPEPSSLAYSFQWYDGTQWNTISSGTILNPSYGNTNTKTYTIQNAENQILPNSENLYRFIVTSVYSGNTNSSTSSSTSVQTPRDITLSGVSVYENANNYVDLSWGASSYANNYKVYYKPPGGSFSLYSTTSSTASRVGPLLPEVTYQFKVIPITGNSSYVGYSGNESNTIDVFTDEILLPGLTPSISSGSKVNESSVSFTLQNYNSSYTFVAKVYYPGGSEGPYPISSSAHPSNPSYRIYTVSGLNISTFTFEITASRAGYTSESSSVSYTFPSVKISNVLAKSGLDNGSGRKLKLSWDPSPANPASYTLQFALDGTFNWTYANNITSPYESNYYYSYGNTYKMYVYGIDSSGDIINGTQSSLTYWTPSQGALPSNTSAPTISGGTQVGDTLTGSIGTWSGDSPISYTYSWYQYTYPYSGASFKAWMPISGTSGSTTYVIPYSDMSIRFYVTATNDAGSGYANSTEVLTTARTCPAGYGSWSAWEDKDSDGNTTSWSACASPGTQSKGQRRYRYYTNSDCTQSGPYYEYQTVSQDCTCSATTTYGNCTYSSWGSCSSCTRYRTYTRSKTVTSSDCTSTTTTENCTCTACSEACSCTATTGTWSAWSAWSSYGACEVFGTDAVKCRTRTRTRTNTDACCDTNTETETEQGCLFCNETRWECNNYDVTNSNSANYFTCYTVGSCSAYYDSSSSRVPCVYS